MRRHNLDHGEWLDWWGLYTEHIKMLRNNTDHFDIYSDDLIAGDTSQFKEVIKNLGLVYNRDIELFIEKRLWHY